MKVHTISVLGEWLCSREGTNERFFLSCE